MRRLGSCDRCEQVRFIGRSLVSDAFVPRHSRHRERRSLAMDWRDKLRAARDATAREINLRNAQLQRFGANAEAVGREVYARTIRTGDAVAAATPSEIRALGIAALQGRLPQAIGQQAAEKAVRSVVAPSGGPRR